MQDTPNIGTRPTVKIGFLGFHRYFNHLWNNITLSLTHRFNLDICVPTPSGHLDRVPNFLFTSVFDNGGLLLQPRFSLFNSPTTETEPPLHRHPRYDGCTKIFTCEENLRTPWKECDYALTPDITEDPRHLRLPVYVRTIRHLLELDYVRDGHLRHPNLALTKTPNENWEKILTSKTKFCNFVVSNPFPAERIQFYTLLSRYKKIDSGGSVLNNLGGQTVSNKLVFLQDFKFTIAFENASHPGYTSEKPLEPMIVSSLPIYWGNPRVDLDFNPQSLVVATARKLDDVVEEVVELDRDDDKYLAKMRTPWFWGNTQNHYCTVDHVADFLDRVFRQSKPRNLP